MMRSLSSAVAGLRTHQTKMDVIGNNIANVNTAGFKSSRATFADVYYQSLSGAASPGTTRGGTNPTQIGYGSNVATIDVLISQSGAQSTDRAMDLYIAGDGFLTTQDSKGNYLYTRLGNLAFDSDGNLVDANGNFVLGVESLSDLNTNGTATSTVMKALNVPSEIYSQLTGISISTSGEVVGVLPGENDWDAADMTAIDNWFKGNAVMTSYDNDFIGEVKISVSMQPTDKSNLPNWIKSVNTAGYDVGMGAAGNWDYSVNSNGLLVVTVGGTTYMSKTEYAPGKEIKLYEYDPVTQLYEAETAFTISTDDDKDLSTAQSAGTTTVAMDIMVDLTATYLSGEVTTQSLVFDRTSTPKTYSFDGFSFTLQGDELLADTGKYANGVKDLGIGKVVVDEGKTYSVGFLMLAKFPNAAGLEQAGSGSFYSTANSGEATFVRPGVEGTGQTTAGYLEMSNVDISKEFTDMITTQRGFQANTRIITVSDEMLQELVNLKR